jgi:hypothetical protein
MQNNIVYPNFQKPKTKEEAFQFLRELTGQYWNSFSPVRPIKTAGIGLGGQAFLVKRIRGKEWSTALRLCYLCGQGILSPRELLMALGRQVVEKEDGCLDVKTSGDMRSNP